MEPHGWRNWKEIPYRGEAGSKHHKSNKLSKFSKLEKTVNFISIVFLVLLSLFLIYLAIHNYLIKNTESTTAFIILSIAVIMLTTAVAQGAIATTKSRRKGGINNKFRRTGRLQK